MWKDLKYLIAYLAPAAAFLGMYRGGWWSPGAFYVAFVIIPLLELFIPANPGNVEPEEELPRSKRKFFDVLLYLNLPIVYGLAAFYIYRVGMTDVTIAEQAGMTLNLGIILGTFGINVAHELGHRAGSFNKWMSRLLLVPEFYTHFTIEHNFGHHKDVATPGDPATARFGESVYAFWWRSATGSLKNAWRLERKRLAREGHAFWSLKNDLLVGVILSVVYLLLGFMVGGLQVLAGLMIAGVIGFLLLESVNYIEHYGLVRDKLPSGRYEPVEPRHSWNSDHELGRIFLYELTRHSDHHYKSTRKYQNLRHMDEAPQLPMGYPAAIVLSLVPPAWRWVIDPRVRKTNSIGGVSTG